jgi:LacI family transcriptional regulator
MKQKNRPVIALFVETSRAYGRDLLRGAALFARTQTNWSLLHQEMTLDSGVPDWLGATRICGVIARVDTQTIEAASQVKRSDRGCVLQS